MFPSVRTTSNLKSLCRPGSNWYILAGMSNYTHRTQMSLQLWTNSYGIICKQVNMPILCIRLQNEDNTMKYFLQYKLNFVIQYDEHRVISVNLNFHNETFSQWNKSVNLNIFTMKINCENYASCQMLLSNSPNWIYVKSRIAKWIDYKDIYVNKVGDDSVEMFVSTVV